MKRTPVILSNALTLSLVCLFACGCRGDRQGTEDRDRTVILPAGETHEGWYFVAAERVILNGTVNGDAYIAAGQVEVHGTINGDLLVAGGDIDVGGIVTEDVRAAGGNVRLNGSVGKNVSAAGGNINVSPPASIAGGLVVACGNFVEGGTVQNNLRAAVGRVEITGSVGKNVDVVGGQLTVARGANVGGDLNALLSEKDQSEIAEGAVKGAISLKQQEKNPSRILGISEGSFWLKTFWIGSLCLAGIILFLISRRFFADYGSIAVSRMGRALLWGLALVFITPVAVLLLCATIVGLPLGLILLALYLTVLYLSQLSIGLAVGARLVGPNAELGWMLYFAFLVGTLIFQGLSLVPYLGTLLEIAALFLGSGALFLATRERIRKTG